MVTKEKVLITGGCGFIGSHLAIQLIDLGFEIRILDNLSSQIHGAIPDGLDWLKKSRIEFMRGSVTVRRDLELALKDVTHIVHLAAETGTGQSMYEVEKYNKINVIGTALLLDILANNQALKIKQFVLASSRSVYGEGSYTCCCEFGKNKRFFSLARTLKQLEAHQWDPICSNCGSALLPIPTAETDKVNPASIYAATKYAQEDLVRISCESLGISFSILRLQNVYGERQSLKNPYTGILSIFSTRIRRGLTLPIFEDGKETRDFVHVNDVVLSILKCLLSDGSINQIINVGSGIATSVIDVATKLSLALGYQPDIKITSEYRLGDIRHNFADIQRLKTILNYEPKIGIEEGLSRFANWVLTQPLPDDLLGKANDELRARNLMG